MRKSVFWVILVFFFWSCGRETPGIWGRQRVKWSYLEWQGKTVKRISGHVPSFSGYFVSLQRCPVKKNGEEIILTPGQGIRQLPGEEVNFPASGCRVILLPDRKIIFEGKGGEGDRQYAILFEGIYLLGKKSSGTYSFTLFPFRGKFKLPGKDIVLAQLLTQEEWEKIREEYSSVSYLGINRVYQVVPLFPQNFVSFFTKGERRVEFYSMVMPLPPPVGQVFPAPGFDFKIVAVGGEKKAVIDKYHQKKGVLLKNYRLPSWAKRIEIRAEGREFGNLAFVTNPYFYTPSSRAPIVVLLSMDTVRAASLAPWGGGANTPNLNALVRESLLFTKAYTPVPWTYDGHMAALFSKYPWESPRRALAEVVQNQGFYTAAFTGGGLVAANLGFARGFLLYAQRPYDIFDRHSSQRLLKQAVSFIEDKSDRPIFLFLHTYQAHSPYLAEGKRFDIVARVGGLTGIFSPLPPAEAALAKRLYEDEISIIDREFLGPFLDFLRKNGLWKRAHIIIFADHGEQFYEHGSWEHGYSLYDEEVHVPLVVHSSKFKKGRDNKPISLISLWELVLKITGGKASQTWKPKRDFVFLATPKSSPPLYFPRKTGIIKDNFKLIHNISIERKFFRRAPSLPKVELYDLQKDPRERNNLYGAKREGITLTRLITPLERLYLEGPGYKPTREELRKLRTLGYAK